MKYEPQDATSHVIIEQDSGLPKVYACDPLTARLTPVSASEAARVLAARAEIEAAPKRRSLRLRWLARRVRVGIPGAGSVTVVRTRPGATARTGTSTQ